MLTRIAFVVIVPLLLILVATNVNAMTLDEKLTKQNNELIKAQQQGNYSGIFDIQISSGLSNCSQLGGMYVGNGSQLLHGKIVNSTSHMTPNQVYVCGIGCANAQSNLMNTNVTDYNKRLPTYNYVCGGVTS